jgi:Flp pilus assembly pilin Flp
MRILIRFVRDTEGQDLVEYALLAVTVALAMAASVSFVLSVMNGSYNQTMTGVGSQWETPNPGGS